MGTVNKKLNYTHRIMFLHMLIISLHTSEASKAHITLIPSLLIVSRLLPLLNQTVLLFMTNGRVDKEVIRQFSVLFDRFQGYNSFDTLSSAGLQPFWPRFVPVCVLFASVL